MWPTWNHFPFVEPITVAWLHRPMKLRHLKTKPYFLASSVFCFENIDRKQLHSFGFHNRSLHLFSFRTVRIWIKNQLGTNWMNRWCFKTVCCMEYGEIFSQKAFTRNLRNCPFIIKLLCISTYTTEKAINRKITSQCRI